MSFWKCNIWPGGGPLETAKGSVTFSVKVNITIRLDALYKPMDPFIKIVIVDVHYYINYRCTTK